MTRDGGQMTLLVVEDNEPSREALSRRLARRGYAVVTAEDGLAAVETAHTARPDLILMDLGLPGIDGWEATARLKAEHGHEPDPNHRSQRPRDDQRSCAGAGRRR